MSSFARYGVIAGAGLLAVILFDVIVVGNAPASTRIYYTAAIRLTLYALSTVAAAMAAAQFGWWREHFGRAWSLFAVEFLFLFINYALRRFAPGVTGAHDITLIVVNAAQIGAYWMMAQALDKAGLGHLISTGKKVAFVLAAGAIAILLSRAELLEAWRAIHAGQVSLGQVLSVLADVITFTLAAPLALSTLTLRGGQISWLYGYLTLSVLGWVVNNGTLVADVLGGGESTVRTVRVASVAMACLFNAAAAITQRSAARRTMQGA